jgi:hypothetical protein
MILGFGKRKVKVNKTDDGSHGEHWQAVFGFDDGIDLQECVRSMWDDVQIEKEIDATYATVRAKYGVFSLLGIQGDDGIDTLFPALYSTKSLPLEIIEILEWEHVDGIEALVTGVYIDTLEIHFFATDYLENKKKYRRGGSLNISPTGIAYAVDSQADLPDRFSADFCSFVPKSRIDRDDYEFTSNVLSISDVKLGEENLKHLEIRLYNGSNASETADLPVITSAKNILCSSLDVGDKVSGSLWMQGRILP